MNKINPRASFAFKEENHDKTFDLYVTQEGDEIIGEDNFYGTIIREAYDSYIYGQCEVSIHSLVGVFSIIEKVKGIEYDEKITVEEIINGSKTISPFTKIYLGGDSVSEAEWSKTTELVEETIKNLGLYGYYIIYYLVDIPVSEFNGETCHSYLEDHDYLYKYGFQNFNR